ncbi:hypothetical protein Y032_0163g3476 [Ancylostoma ceylanicum]|uniref:Uncharacterized protein n=1 Tax=Ancylostoma ceylanicum TaxID=53326 RepID=A0A016SXP3_9BILA|nr:hypothetical protein Y032_0163g3476 [Ancylostoma ceylanicum]
MCLQKQQQEIEEISYPVIIEVVWYGRRVITPRTLARHGRRSQHHNMSSGVRVISLPVVKEVTVFISHS